MWFLQVQASESLSSSSSPSFSTEGGSRDLLGQDNSWQEIADSSEVVEEDLCAIYAAALEDSKFDCAELTEVHTLIEKAQVTLDPRSPMVRTVMRDMKQLQEANLVHSDSAIFVRQVRVWLWVGSVVVG